MSQSERMSHPRPGACPAARARSAESQPTSAGDSVRAPAQREAEASLHDSPRQQAQRQQIQAAFGNAPVQRLVYFSDDDGAQAQTAKPKNHPYWESPLSGTDQSLHNTADGARAAAVGALNVGALDPLSEEPTKFSGGGPPSNGSYEFWHNTNTGAVVGHPTHTQDVTNKLTRVSKIGKAPEKRTEFKPVVHDHAADYGVPDDPYALLANPGVTYAKAAGAMDHYLQKPTD